MLVRDVYRGQGPVGRSLYRSLDVTHYLVSDAAELIESVTVGHATHESIPEISIRC